MPSSSKKWFVLAGETRKGPFGVSEIKNLASAGKITSKTKLWKEDLDKPVSASRIRGLIFSSAASDHKNPEPAQEAAGSASSSDDSATKTRSRSELREFIASQRSEIGAAAHSSAVDCSELAELKSRFVAVTGELQELKAKLPRIQSAGEKLKIAEQNAAVAQKKVDSSEKELLAFAEELGRDGFQGLETLPDSGKQYFAEREELSSKIASTEQEMAGAAASSNATLLEKTKAKASQLKLAAQLQIEKLKVKPANRRAGNALLSENDEEMVRSSVTEAVLDRIAIHRQALSGLKRAAAEFAVPLDQAIKDAALAVESPVSNFFEFAAIAWEHEALIAKRNDEIESTNQQATDLIISQPSVARSLGLDVKVGELSEAARQLEDSKNPTVNPTVAVITIASIYGLVIFWNFMWAGAPEKSVDATPSAVLVSRPLPPTSNPNVKFYKAIANLPTRDVSDSSDLKNYFGERASGLRRISGGGVDDGLTRLRDKLVSNFEALQDQLIKGERFNSGANSVAWMVLAYRSGQRGDMFGPALQHNAELTSLKNKVEDLFRENSRLIDRLNQRARDIGILQ